EFRRVLFRSSRNPRFGLWSISATELWGPSADIPLSPELYGLSYKNGATELIGISRAGHVHTMIRGPGQSGSALRAFGACLVGAALTGCSDSSTLDNEAATTGAST